jgi:glycosyltransferase involved in cell wall biosynthesis
MIKRNKLLLVYPAWSSFVKTDFQILSEEYDVTCYHFRPVKGIFRIFLEFLRQFFFLLLKIWRYKTIYIWFADQHSFLPILFSRLTRAKSFLVIGGYDVCRMPKLNYGVFCSKARGFAAAWSMRNCSLNLPVSDHVARKVKAISRRTDSPMVYNCVNLPDKESMENRPREWVLTVAVIDSERTFYIKGIDTFIETARLLPEIPFAIIGYDKEKLNLPGGPFPENLTLISRVSHEDLREYYQRTKVYCQLSRSESFGIALAEAITFGCVPVVTAEGGLPEVAGENGYVVKREPADYC